MKLRLTPQALRDIEDVAEYIHRENPLASRRVSQALRSALRLIETHPEVGALQVGGLRRLTLPRYPYLIYYRLDIGDDAVDVLTIRHASRARDFL